MRPQLLLPVFILILASFALAGCGSPAQREAIYLQRGNKLFGKGQYEKARVEYKNAGRIMPADPEVAYRFGLVDEAEGDYRGAFAGFTHAEEQDSHFHPALLKLAEYYIAAERLDDAQTRVDRVLAEDPGNADAHALRGSLLLRQQDFAGTEREARLALVRDPSDVIAFSVLTGLYEAQGNDANAIKTVEEGIARNPKSMPLLLLRAEIYERSGNLAKIAESYGAIFKLAPQEARYRVNLALAYLKAGQIDNAEATLRAGVAAMPDDLDMKKQLVTFLADHRSVDAAEKEIRGYMQQQTQGVDFDGWLVDLYVTHDQIDRAVTFLNEVIAKNQDDQRGLDARAALARIDYIKGDKDSAAKLADAVLEKDQNNLDALLIRAHIEADHGFYQNAVVDLRTILRGQPKAEEALRLLGETLLLQGHLDLAIDTFSQLVEINPLDFAARVRLAQLYQLSGDSKHAMDLLFFVTKAEPKYAVGWESTARVAIAAKDWATADAAIRNLDALDGQHPTAAFLRGQMLAQNGKFEDAIAQYKQVIDPDPSTPLAARAMAALAGAYQKLGRSGEAARYIASLKSGNPAVSTILGESNFAAGKTDEAAADFDQAISSNASDPEPYLDRARMFLYAHKTDEALEILKKGAAAAPNDIRAPMMEARILGELGRYREAIALYEDLLARDPDLDAVANNLAEIIADYEYADPAALEKAHRMAQRFTASSNPLLLDTLAWVDYRQGNIEEARTTMERAMSLGGSNMPPQVHYHYGAILLKADKASEAKAELQKAVVKDASYTGLEDAKKMLAGL